MAVYYVPSTVYFPGWSTLYHGDWARRGLSERKMDGYILNDRNLTDGYMGGQREIADLVPKGSRHDGRDTFKLY